MYSSKYSTNRRVITGEKVPFLADKEKFQDRKEPVLPRHRGKQFMTNPPKGTAGADYGHFHRLKHHPEKYQDGSGYLKAQPLSNRRLGFGSHDAKRRDEFMQAIRTEQYRQQLRTEDRISRRRGAAAKDEGAPKPEGTRPVSAAPRRKSVSMYDRVHTDATNRRLGKFEERKLGAYHLSSRSVGTEAWAVSRPEHGAFAVTKDFYFKGHTYNLM